MASGMAVSGRTDQELSELLALIKGADSVELKVSVPLSNRSKAGRRSGSTRSTARSGRCTSSTHPTWR